jgi:hypothetical protein
VLIIVDKWVKSQKTPVPRSHILTEMGNGGIKKYTAIFSINSVVDKGYIRRAITSLNRSHTYYVQLRTIHYDNG